MCLYQVFPKQGLQYILTKADSNADIFIRFIFLWIFPCLSLQCVVAFNRINLRRPRSATRLSDGSQHILHSLFYRLPVFLRQYLRRFHYHHISRWRRPRHDQLFFRKEWGKMPKMRDSLFMVWSRSASATSAKSPAKTYAMILLC